MSFGKRLHIDEIKITQEGKSVAFSAVLNSSDGVFLDQKLWFRFPSVIKNYITSSGDPFLAGLLPLCMQLGFDLYIHGTVSKKLLNVSDQIQKVYSNWYDSMNPVTIVPDHFAVPEIPDIQTSASYFTGGVDSFYTVLKNLESRIRKPITHLIYVAGYDIALEEKKLLEFVYKELDAVAKKLNLKLLKVSTNLKKVCCPYVEWGAKQHGASLAAVGLCLSNYFSQIYIPSSRAYNELVSWGSHPNLDPLWSMENVEFIHDGNEANRMQKISWRISKSDVALKHLRVCWENPNREYNCGKCEKCIRTKIALKEAGALRNCRTLDDHIDFQLLQNILSNSSKSISERKRIKGLCVSIYEEIERDPALKKDLSIVLDNVDSYNSFTENIRSFVNRVPTAIKGRIKPLLKR